MMVQKIVTLCTVCYKGGEGVEVAGKTYEPILLPGMRKPRFVDLCDEHAKELNVETLTAAVLQYGDPVDKTPPPVGNSVEPQPVKRKADSGGYWCPAEGCAYPKQITGRAGLRSHLAKRHDIEMAELEGERGETFDGEKITEWCDQTGCKAGFTSGTGVAAHKLKRHGIAAS